MRHIFGLLVVVILLIGSSVYLFSQNRNDPVSISPKTTQSQLPPDTEIEEASTAPMSIIAEGLDTPWAIAFLPDKSMLVTERPGNVRFVDSDGRLDSTPVASLANVKEIGEGGLLGIALHPDFSTNNYVYFYYTFAGSGNGTLNRVVRMTYRNKQLTNEQTIVERIPGASNHNGGRIKFGSDSYLYITTGDAQEPSLAQNRNSLGGKILRVTDEGKPAPGNPFGSTVYSYGHRNPQGLAWDKNGNLWSTEHGPSGAQSGNDEVNKIEPGKNYGWPTIQGDQGRAGMEMPIVHSGTAATWAPAGAAFIGDSLFFGGLRGEALYVFNTTTTQGGVSAHFDGELGRIREVIQGPDGMLYITTSNKDGRGSPQGGDDKIIRVNTERL